MTATDSDFTTLCNVEKCQQINRSYFDANRFHEARKRLVFFFLSEQIKLHDLLETQRE